MLQGAFYMVIGKYNILEAYVSSQRDKIILKALDWISCLQCNAILFSELDNGMQISSGQPIVLNGDVANIQKCVRNALLECEQMLMGANDEFESNAQYATVLLWNDYFKEEM